MKLELQRSDTGMPHTHMQERICVHMWYRIHPTPQGDWRYHCRKCDAVGIRRRVRGKGETR